MALCFMKPLRKWLFGGTVPPNNMHAGGTLQGPFQDPSGPFQDMDLVKMDRYIISHGTLR